MRNEITGDGPAIFPVKEEVSGKVRTSMIRNITLCMEMKKDEEQNISHSSFFISHLFHDPSFEVFDLIQFQAFISSFRGDLFHIMGDHPADQRLE